jgi:hypothetical protein
MAWDYETEVAADTPWLWWKLNETSGTTATDDGSSGQDGTYAGTAAEYAQDQDPIIWDQGRCVEFNEDGGGANDGRVELAAVSSFPSDEIAFEYWFEDPTSVHTRIPISYYIGGPVAEVVVQHQGNSQINLFMNGIGNVVTLTLNSANNNFSDGRPHHLYIDWRASDGRVRLFYDGVYHAISTGFQTGTTLASGGTLMLGQWQSAPGVPNLAAQAWQGRLDQFAIYDGQLTATRIQAHASAGLVRYVPLVDVLPPATEPEIERFVLGGDVVPITYLQKIYDSSVGFVYYTRESTANPPSPALAVGDTQPNHTNNLDLSTHVIVKAI